MADESGADRGGSLRTLNSDESLVELRCSVIVRRGDDIVLIERRTDDAVDWVLPGGRPRPGESMHACARREVFEETGLRVNPGRCAFVGEVIDPDRHMRVVELIFLSEPDHLATYGDLAGESDAQPKWCAMNQLAGLHLRPPIAGFLSGLRPAAREGAAYLGNLWRPRRGDRASGDELGLDVAEGP